MTLSEIPNLVPWLRYQINCKIRLYFMPIRFLPRQSYGWLQNTVPFYAIGFFSNQNYDLPGDRIIIAKQVQPILAIYFAKSQHTNQILNNKHNQVFYSLP